MGYTIDLNSELYHFGIPGMKWGRKKAKQKQSQQKQSQQKQSQQNSLAGMSTRELNQRTSRLNAERNYLLAQQRLSDMTQKKSVGKQFVKKIGKDVVAAALVNVGRSYLEQNLRKMLKKVW